MMVYWPGVTEGNSLNDQRVMVEDFYPTILEMAGVTQYSPIQTIDGVSFVKALKQPAYRYERPIYWHFPNLWGGNPKYRRRLRSLFRYFERRLSPDLHLGDRTKKTIQCQRRYR